MARVDGKVAIITGGARGIGAAMVRLFVNEGAKVVIADVLEADGAKLASELGEKAIFQKLDVQSDNDWAAVVAAAEKAFGPVNILVNNAGIMHATAIEELVASEAERVFAVNIMGAMLGIKHVVPAMKKAGRGAIVNVSSVDGLRGCNGLSVYSASKWAVRGMTKSLALELGPRGIRVCSVHPGGVNTSMGNPSALDSDAVNKDYSRVPLQRIGKPEEIANATLFVASDDASYLSGAEIAVDGGWSAGYYQPLLPGAPAGIE